MGHEPERNDWLGTTLRRSDAAPPDACVDAEILAAWADGGLSAQAASAVESHISSCSRCMAVLAALERSAPAPQPRDAWTRARLFRWLVPLTAAATAIAIWVLVPDRQITSTLTAPVETSETPRARPPEPDAAARSQSPAPPAQALEPQAKRDLAEADSSAAKAAPQLRDELRRDRAASVREEKSLAQAPPAPPSAPPPGSASPEAAADAVAGLAAAQARRFSVNSATASNESISPSNSLHIWRVSGSSTVERSTDGGQTWMKTVFPPAGATAAPLTIVSVRAVDDRRAVVRATDGTEFYTVDAGLTWTRVQENSTAPF